MPARMYQALSPLVPRLELGPPIASWTFLGGGCGQQRALRLASFCRSASPEHREVWAGDREDGPASQLVELHRCQARRWLWGYRGKRGHPDSQRAPSEEQEEASGVVALRVQIQGQACQWMGGQEEGEQLGCRAWLGAGPWRPCGVLSGSQEGCCVSLFRPRGRTLGGSTEDAMRRAQPCQMGRCGGPALSSAPDVPAYSPLGTVRASPWPAFSAWPT